MIWALRRLGPSSLSRRLEAVRTLTFRSCADNGPLTRLAVQGALQWLEDNQDKSLEDIEAAEAAKAADADEDEDETKAKIAELESGQDARSLVCNDCGKRFRNQALASYHASKT